MRRRTKVLIALVAAAALAAVVVVHLRSRRRQHIEVTTEKVWRRDLVEVVEASGTIEPKISVDITSDVIAKIIDVPVEEGDHVRRGAVLVRLDTGQQEQRVRSAEAALSAARTRVLEMRSLLDKARADFERAQSMYQEQLLSRAEYDRIASEREVTEHQLNSVIQAVAESEAALAEARDQLRKHTVSAPMDGTVIRREADVGEVAVAGTLNNAGNLLMQVADLSVMEVEVKVDETEVVDLVVGQPAEVEVDAFPGRTFRGRVTRVANSAALEADSTSVTGEKRSADFKVEITLEETDPRLRPGLNATARIVTATRAQVLSLPIQSLTVRELPSPDGKGPRRKQEQEGAFVVDGDSVSFRTVKTGIASERYFELLEGLKGGEEIVSGNYQALRQLQDGDGIRRAEKPKPKTKGDAAK
jgi:HlyD family secretion protein